MVNEPGGQSTLIHLCHNHARTETDLASTTEIPSMKELLGVKEEDEKQRRELVFPTQRYQGTNEGTINRRKAEGSERRVKLEMYDN